MQILLPFYRATFGRVVALLYTAGTLVHLLRSCVEFGSEGIPFAADWAIIVLGAYGVTGLLFFAREVAYRGTWEKLLHGLIVIHLLILVAVHLWIVLECSHAVLDSFPLGYSYCATLYFGVLAWRGWTMRLK